MRALPPDHDDHDGRAHGHAADRASAWAPAPRRAARSGLAVVGGLAFSQLVTLYVTPVIYTYLDAFQRRLRGRREGPPAAVPAERRPAAT